MLKRKPGGQLLPGELEKAKDLIVAHIETAARAGALAPSSRTLRKIIGLGDKATERIFAQLKADGRLSWHTIQGGKSGQVRIITVHASGWRTAYPAAPTPPPKKKHHPGFVLKGKPPVLGLTDRSLYGPIEYAVKILRRRHFVVFKEDHGVRVGNKLLQPWQVEQLAARESRLMVSA